MPGGRRLSGKLGLNKMHKTITTRYDAIILGAGINGVSIAKAMVNQRLTVLVLEQSTIGSGTSSKSSRLIHGGLRYLESPTQWGLVRESLMVRKELCQRYPDLVKMTPFYFPVFKDSQRPPWLIQQGLRLYDMFSKWEFPASRISLEEFRALYPMIASDKIAAVFRYYDGKTDDLLLTQRIAEDATRNDVRIIENAKIENIELNQADHIQVNFNGQQVSSKILINATGPWIDEVNKRFDLPARYTINKVSGIHIRIARAIPYPLFLQAQYPRVFFMIPEGETTMIGTTERAENGPMDSLEINQKDIDYLIEQANQYLAAPISNKDIVSQSIGMRALIRSKKDLNWSSREAKIDIHNLGQDQKVIQVFGGKLTSALALGRKLANYAF